MPFQDEPRRKIIFSHPFEQPIFCVLYIQISLYINLYICKSIYIYKGDEATQPKPKAISGYRSQH